MTRQGTCLWVDVLKSARVVQIPDSIIFALFPHQGHWKDRQTPIIQAHAPTSVPLLFAVYVTLESASLVAPSNGYGTLATITFQVVDTKASELFLSQATLVNPDGERFYPSIENPTMEEGAVIEAAARAEDINNDGVVDIVDLVKVAAAFRNAATAPF